MFTPRDLAQWAQAIVDAQKFIDRGEAARVEIADLEGKRDKVKRELEDTSALLEKSKTGLAEFKTAHDAAMDRMRAERQQVRDTLEAEKAARAVSKQAGETKIREEHAALSSSLINERDALKTEVENLRRFKGELTREIEQIGQKFGAKV